jgi:hypothetical protein
MTATCRSCGAEIVWATTVDGKRMPLNAEPAEGGDFDLLDTGSRLLIVRHGDGDPGPAYTSHFATCPHAETWRRSR